MHICSRLRDTGEVLCAISPSGGFFWFLARDAKVLQFCYKSLPAAFTFDERKLSFWIKCFNF